MATGYSFLGDRLNSSASKPSLGSSTSPIKPAPITTNDRQFTCDASKCNLDSSAAVQDYTFLSANNHFNLNLEIFNVELIQDYIDNTLSQVTMIRDAYMEWLAEKETAIELKVSLRNVPINQTLFNKLNILIPKLVQSKKLFSQWFSEFHLTILDIAENLQKYSEAQSKIESLFVASTNASGLEMNIVTVAKENQSKSKSIQKQITRLMAMDAKIRFSIKNLQYKMRELYDGVLRVGDRTLNIKDLGALIDELSGGESPLVRVRNMLANIINSTQETFTLKTNKVTQLHIPDAQQLMNTLQSGERVSEESVLNYLNDMANYRLYTTESEKVLVPAFTAIIKIYSNSPRFPEMQQKINEIKHNAPHIIISNIRSDINENRDIYLIINRIENIQKNLTGQDITVYGNELRELYDMAATRARQNIRQELNENNNDDDDNETPDFNQDITMDGSNEESNA